MFEQRANNEVQIVNIKDQEDFLTCGSFFCSAPNPIEDNWHAYGILLIECAVEGR